MSKRLAGYDYSQPGLYFVTICIEQHRLVFGSIVNDQMILRRPGRIAESVWHTLPRRFAHVKLDAYVVMPNHFHGIIELTDGEPPPGKTRAELGEIVRTFKGATTYQVRHTEGTPWFVWQEEYYDAIIRTDAALQQFRQYICNNPLRWSEDKLYQRY